MSWADTVAVKALVESVPALTGRTFVTRTDDGKPLVGQYALIHPADGADSADRFTGSPVTTHPSFTLHIVGSSANQVQVLTALLKAKFTDAGGFIVPPVVAGRSNTAGYWRSPIPLQTDTDVSPALVYQVIELGWDSEPA